MMVELEKLRAQLREGLAVRATPIKTTKELIIETRPLFINRKIMELHLDFDENGNPKLQARLGIEVTPYEYPKAVSSFLHNYTSIPSRIRSAHACVLLHKLGFPIGEHDFYFSGGQHSLSREQAEREVGKSINIWSPPRFHLVKFRNGFVSADEAKEDCVEILVALRKMANAYVAKKQRHYGWTR